MLEKQITTDTLTAMKNSDKFKVSVLRMLKSALQSEKINSKSTDLNDEQVIMVIKKQLKERSAGIEEYTKYNRIDMVNDLKQEIAILEVYLPKQLSHEELEVKVQEILKNYPDATIKDMGKIMKEARIQIILRERIPLITISPDAKVAPVAFFTTDGKLIGREFLPLDKSFKTILVLSYGNKGDDYHKWDLNKIHQIEKIAKYVETYSGEPVEYIDLRNPFDVYVKIKTVNIRIGQLDENVYKRIERIPSLLPQVKLIDSKIKYLDLKWDKVNYLKLE